jgi:hypothetical protein
MHFDYASMALSKPADGVRGFRASGLGQASISKEGKKGIPLIGVILSFFIALATAYHYLYTTLSLIEIGAIVISWLIFIVLGTLICGLVGYLLWGLTDFAISIEIDRNRS